MLSERIRADPSRQLRPVDSENHKGCVSPGVSLECGFDANLADLGIDVYLADASLPARQPPINVSIFLSYISTQFQRDCYDR